MSSSGVELAQFLSFTSTGFGVVTAAARWYILRMFISIVTLAIVFCVMRCFLRLIVRNNVGVVIVEVVVGGTYSWGSVISAFLARIVISIVDVFVMTISSIARRKINVSIRTRMPSTFTFPFVSFSTG